MTINALLIFIFLILALHYAAFIAGIYLGLNTALRKEDAKADAAPEKDFVSVIVPFRNEAGNIVKSCRCFKNLEYPRELFEVIYVNDSSEDDGKAKLTAEVEAAKNIKIIDVPKNRLTRGHKKNAVALGIENSKGEIIVTTDADCEFGPGWLCSLLNSMDAETGFVSGPVKFKPDGSLFAKIQELEFAGLVLAGAGLIGSGKPVICNGANIAYRRNLFYRVNGFDGNMNLSSGDDELLMQKIAAEGKYKIRFCANEDSLVTTNANLTLGGFIRQRRRWASKSPFYKDRLFVMRLAIVYFFYLFFIASPFMMFINTWLWGVGFAAMFILKTALENSVIKKGRKLLSLNYNIVSLIIAEIFQIIYIVILSAAGIAGGFKWKNRNLAR
jgi:cellulose synthase/poly-beta-1,6-N-acetylglucosamine synthase-like glycosyltransferase